MAKKSAARTASSAVLGLLGLEASDVAADAGGEVSVAALEDVLAQHRRTILHDWRGYLDDGLQLLADRLAELKIVLEIDSGGDDDSAVIAVGEQWAKVRYIPNESDFDKTVVAPLNALIAGRAECRRLRCSEDWDTYAYWVLAADAWQTLDASYPQVAALFLPARAAKLRSSAKPRLAAKKKAAWTPKKHIAATREGAFEKFDAEFAKEVRDVEDWIRDPHAQTTKTAVLGFMPVVFGLRLRNMGGTSVNAAASGFWKATPVAGRISFAAPTSCTTTSASRCECRPTGLVAKGVAK